MVHSIKKPQRPAKDWEKKLQAWLDEVEHVLAKPKIGLRNVIGRRCATKRRSQKK